VISNDHKDNKDMNQRIFDLFRKKPDVISNQSSRNTAMRDPGYNLAMELFQENVLKVKKINDRKNMFSTLS